ncbi:MAG: carboxypeptidase-like regulatory domain-containing protein [Mariniphaga sp.]
MRLSTRNLMLLLLILLGFKLSGQEHLPVLEHRLTCRVDSSSVEQILEKIVNENTLFFSYNPDILPKGLISLNLCNITVDELLRKILPVNDYRIDKLDNQLIITRKEATPIKLSGIVVEGRRETPIVYASVGIEGESIGTMTNIDGKYDLIIPWRLRTKTVSIRCLGFKPQEISIEILKLNPKITMEPISIHLREIEVKPVDVSDVLKKFRKNIEQNYEGSTQMMVTFYRETIRRDNQYVGIWEAIMEVLKHPYDSSVADRVRFLKGRKSNFQKYFNDVTLKIQGGPWYITTLDIVRNLETFLDPKFENLYKYRFEQPEMFNGRVIWVIRFSRNADIEFPCYYGRILIDAESYALVSAEFGLDKKSLKLNGETFIKKEPFGYVTRPEGAEYSVKYRMINGRWQFFSARTDVTFQVRQKKGSLKTEYRSVSDILVTQQFPFPSHVRFGPEGLFRADDIFSDIKGSYDPDFWGNYNVIKPDEDLGKALRAVEGK